MSVILSPVVLFRPEETGSAVGNDVSTLFDERVTRRHFQLGCDRQQLTPLLEKLVTAGRLCGAILAAEESRVGIALQEALLNAMIHGNLEISSELRETDSAAFERLISLRQLDPRYGRRVVCVECIARDGEVVYVITDEGPGFDVATLPDPRDEEHIFLCSGRGVLLMRTLMDSVDYNERGNEVTLTKRRA